MKNVENIIVSLSCLVQFGALEDNELVQRALKHSAFLAYEQGEIDRISAISIIAAKYKAEASYLESLLNQVPIHTKVDEELLSLLISTGKRLIGWVDMPSLEWKQIHSSISNTVWEHFSLISDASDVCSITHSKNDIIIDRTVEIASKHAFHSFRALPYTPITKSSCRQVLQRLSIPTALKRGEMALQGQVLNNTSLESLILHSSGVTKQQYIFDFFALFLAGICVPGVVTTKAIEYVKEMVVKGEPFGFAGKDFSKFPPDLDSMSISTSVLFEMGHINHAQASQILEHCLRNVNNNGELLVYVDPDRPRHDPVVVANTIYLAYSLGKENDPIVRKNEAMLQNFLLTGGYVFGTLYYPQQESFLFHYGRVVAKFKDKCPNFRLAHKEISMALVNLIGNAESKPFDIARRLLLCQELQIDNHADLDLLLGTQKEDGSWPLQIIYTAPTINKVLYNAVVDLSFACKALKLSS